jgi:hypothetical protein
MLVGFALLAIAVKVTEWAVCNDHIFKIIFQPLCTI